jgi:P27 family predicted phage terminase small subunit
MAGRPPKPTALKALQGNPGKRPLNKREPKSSVLTSEPPPWLDEYAKEAWEQISPLLVGMRVLTEADAPALCLLVKAWSDWRTADAVIQREGTSFEVKEWDRGAEEFVVVSIRRRPEVAERADAWRRVRLALTDFGMTPSARSRVVTADEGDPEDELDKFLGGAQ